MWNKRMAPLEFICGQRANRESYCASFGGGGHTLACGIPSVTKSQILEVDAELKEAVKTFKKN